MSYADPGCPSGYRRVNGECEPMENPRGGGGGGCPPGQIPKANGQGCKPAGQWWDESPDELSTQGLETCDEADHPSPKECYWCDFDTRKWKRGWCDPNASGGGKGGSGSSGGAKPGSAWKPPVFAVPTNDIERTIWENIQNTLSGKDLPYSDEAVAANKASLFSATQGRTQQAQRGLDESLIESGMFRSGARAKGRADIGRSGQQTYTKGVGDILAQKTMVNYQAKVDALGRAKGLLDGQRDFLLRSEGNDIARTQGLAQIQLGYANIANQMAMLQKQLASNWDIAQLGQSNNDMAAILALLQQMGR